MKNILQFCICTALFLLTDSIEACPTNPLPRNGDLLAQLINQASFCPQTVQEWKALLNQAGLRTQAAMVANRGRNNSQLGSFSFFETVEPSPRSSMTGPLFFGHFTAVHNQELQLEQAPEIGALLIEAIAWDPQKKLFNFYELIGKGKHSQWFYRGDSVDILADNQNLHLQPQGAPVVFGNRLRCSGCHNSGGPIMKELSPPHNDWWSSTRSLILKPYSLSLEIQNELKQLQPAEQFAKKVKAGIALLESSPTYQAQLRSNLQNLLKPLFCESEINLESALPSYDSGSSFIIPSASLLSPFWGQFSISVVATSYRGWLAKYGVRFPEGSSADADHSWLTPVKSARELFAIENLIKQKIVSKNFTAAVLAIDIENPTLSELRCSLLRLVPKGAPNANWPTQFIANLKSSSLPQAKELYMAILSEKNDPLIYQQKITSLLKSTPLERQFERLLITREKVKFSDISKNPLGQILEPGFRVIFPQAKILKPTL